MLQAISDQDLWSSVRAGESSAFEELVRRHQGAVCAVTLSLTGDPNLSEDLAQDTFVQAWVGRENLRDPGKVGAWLRGIARKLAASTQRRRARAKEVQHAATATPTHPRTDIETEVARRQSFAMVWSAMESVPPKCREALVLYYREGQSTREVAAALGISVASAEQRLSRGRSHLRGEVEARIDEALRESRPDNRFCAAVVAALPTMDAAPATTDTAAWSASAWALAVAACIAIVGGALAFLQEPPATAPSATAAATAVPAAALTPTERERMLRALAAVQEPKARPDPAGAANGRRTPYALSRINPRSVGVNLQGGATELYSPAMVEVAAPEPAVRTLRGRVLDPEGRALAAVIVLAGPGLSMSLSTTLTARYGVVTAEDGGFEIPLSPAKRPLHALALDRDRGWSALTPIGEGTDDVELVLTLEAPAGIEVELTRGGEPASGTVIVQHQDMRPFQAIHSVDASGRIHIEAMPHGALELRAFEGSFLRGGLREHVVRPFTFVPGQHPRVHIELPVGGMVAVEVTAPENPDMIMLEYALIDGRLKVPTHAELRRLLRELPPATTRVMSYGGIDLDAPMEFTDLAAGEYTACATSVARDRVPLRFLCLPVTLAAQENKGVQVDLRRVPDIPSGPGAAR